MAGIHRRRKRATTTDQYAAMMARMMRAYGKRIAEEPAAGLAHLREIESALTDATNLGIYLATQNGQSPTALAEVLGVTRQAIYKRAALGEQAAEQRRQPAVDTTRVAQPRELTAGDQDTR